MNDTRSAIYRGWGYLDRDEIRDKPQINTDLTHFLQQDYYVEIWFEAMAMAAQFRYYTKGITLRSFRGDGSIDFKC